MTKRAYGGPLHRIAKIVHRPGNRAVTLRDDHAAIRESRTLFPSTVTPADESPRLLVNGFNQRKVGGRVTKGVWKGMPIFTLTLEERATCPTSCKMWHACYGNNMPFARRHRLDEEMILLLMAELWEKNRKHPGGFVVRAHILGDFGSPDDPELAALYIKAWRAAFDELPALRMFSYTAHGPDTAIGTKLRMLNASFPERCWIRFSGHRLEREGAVVIESKEESESVVCPAQTDDTDCCGTCGLCWSMNRTIEFLKH